MDFKKFFFLFLFYINLSNNDIISWRQGLKSGIEARSVSGRKNDIFWCKIGSGFGEPKGTPPPKIPRSTRVFRVPFCLRVCFKLQIIFTFSDLYLVSPPVFQDQMVYRECRKCRECRGSRGHTDPREGKV